MFLISEGLLLQQSYLKSSIRVQPIIDGKRQRCTQKISLAGAEKQWLP